MSLVDSLLGAIVRLNGESLVLHVGEKPYVVTSTAAPNAFRGPIEWGQVELSTRTLTVQAVSSILDQLLTQEHRRTLDEIGAVDRELPARGELPAFTVIAARGGDDIWLEVRPLKARPEAEAAASAAVAEAEPPAEQDLHAPAHAEPEAAGAAATDEHDDHGDAATFEIVPEIQQEQPQEHEVIELLASAGLLEAGANVTVAPVADEDADAIVEWVPDGETDEDEETLDLTLEDGQGVPAAADVPAVVSSPAVEMQAEEVQPDALAEAPVAGAQAETPAEPRAEAPAPPATEAELPAVPAEAIFPTREDDLHVPVFDEPAAAPEEPAPAPVAVEASAWPAPHEAREDEPHVPVLETPVAAIEELTAPFAAGAYAGQPADPEEVFELSAVDVHQIEAAAFELPDGSGAMVEDDAAAAPAPALPFEAAASAEADPSAAPGAPAEIVAAVPAEPVAPPAAAAVDVPETAPAVDVPAPAPADWSAESLSAPAADRDGAAALAEPPPQVAADTGAAMPAQAAAPAPAERAEPARVAEAPVRGAADRSEDAPVQAANEPVQAPADGAEPAPAAEAPYPSLVDPGTARPAIVVPMSRSPREAGGVMGGAVPPVSAPDLDRLLRIAAARGASGLYLVAQSQPVVRVDGEMQPLDGEEPVTAADVEAFTFALAPEPSREAVRSGATSEWFRDVPDVGRVRCFAFRDHRGPGVIVRMLPARAISAEQLGLSKEIQALCGQPDGFVLVAGPRASGTSTLIAAFVDLINRSRADHVITIERQISFVHESRRSFVSQREVRGDADELAIAVRTALREDPDVLVVEELRSADMIAAVLEAAESGRFVLAGLRAPATVPALERLVEQCPAERRPRILTSLSTALRGVVGQVLLRKRGGGRIAARELLLNTPAAAALIAEGKLFQLPAALESGRKVGSLALNDALAALIRDGIVDAGEAWRKAYDREGLLTALKREGIDTTFVERLA